MQNIVELAVDYARVRGLHIIGVHFSLLRVCDVTCVCQKYENGYSVFYDLQASDWSALDIVLTYHGKDTLPHRYERPLCLAIDLFIHIFHIKYIHNNLTLKNGMIKIFKKNRMIKIF